MWNDTPLSPRHYSRYSLPQIYETSPHNIAPTKGCPCHMFSLIFKPIINYPVSLLSIVLEFSVETVTPFVFVFVDSTIGCYMAVFYTITARAFEELAIFFFLSPEFSSRNFSSVSFSCFLVRTNSIFQNQRVCFLRSLYAISEILILQDTTTGLYYSVRNPNTRSLISS